MMMSAVGTALLATVALLLGFQVVVSWGRRRTEACTALAVLLFMSAISLSVQSSPEAWPTTLLALGFAVVAAHRKVAEMERAVLAPVPVVSPVFPAPFGQKR